MGASYRLRPIRWHFAHCTFDESKWTLNVSGRRVTIEAKPLELLRELLVANGELVTKDHLLDRVWPEVHVVEASLTTAVHKLRHALGDDKRQRRMIETVSGIGYRMGVPVTAEALDGIAEPVAAQFPTDPTPTDVAVLLVSAPKRVALLPKSLVLAAGLGLATAAVAIVYGPFDQAERAIATHQFSPREAKYALRNLDVPKVEKMLGAGWDANTHFDSVGTTALTYVIQICEWDHAHDRRKMLMMARTLIDAGADIDERNVFGDTPYSIAKAKRYCGPDHPVTQMLEAMCYGGDLGPKDLCLATYELSADQRKSQGIPPKS